MTLNYFFKTGEIRRTVSYGYGDYEDEWDGDEGYEFEYEIDSSEIIKALVHIFKYNAYYKIKNLAPKRPNNAEYQNIASRKMTKEESTLIDMVLYSILGDIEDIEQLEEIAEYYRDEITDYYEDVAMESQMD